MRLSIVLILAGALRFFLPAGGTAPPTNEYVKFTVGSPQKTVKAGAKAELLFTLTPRTGIHVNLQPALDLKLDSIPGIVPAGRPEVPRRDSFLDASKPIRQTLTLANNLPAGVHTIRGTLIYYYCSDAEGWCSRFKQAFEVGLTVAR